MLLVILPIPDAMIREARLPDGAAIFQAIRESSFDELHGMLQGDFFRRSEQRMDVVGHNDEFVEQEFSSVAVVREGVKQESSGCFPAKDWTALDGDGGDEEDAVGVHFAMVMGMAVCCL